MLDKIILHVDTNHPWLWDGLEQLGFKNELDTTSSKDQIMQRINSYHGIVIRSRFTLEADFLAKATQLEFIARVGAGLENIDQEFAKKNHINLIAAPEGNCNAVGEHALGLLLNLMNHIHRGHQEIKNGIWLREENRGEEIEGKTIGLIGYGHTGKKFAKKLAGFDANVIFYDILPNLEDGYAKQVTIEELQNTADVISLHVPLTSLTNKMIAETFIEKCKNPFWLINTARGACVDTTALLKALDAGKIKGAGLDVLEFEKTSFETIFEQPNDTLYQLIHHPKVILTPHIAGWTHESNQKLAHTIVEKIKKLYF